MSRWHATLTAEEQAILPPEHVRLLEAVGTLLHEQERTYVVIRDVVFGCLQREVEERFPESAADVQCAVALAVVETLSRALREVVFAEDPGA